MENKFMIETSENFNISLIKGKTLNQVCIGLYQVVLRFDNDISISCASKMYLIDGKSNKEAVFPPYSKCFGILELLGEQIINVELDQNETLRVIFQSKTAVEIEGKNEGYEAFEIWINNNFLIV
jgi:hypothetical protein